MKLRPLEYWNIEAAAWFRETLSETPASIEYWNIETAAWLRESLSETPASRVLEYRGCCMVPGNIE